MTRSIILVFPNAGQDVLGINVGLPLSVIYVGTALRNAGYNVKILDQRVTADFEHLLADAVAENPIFVGISSMTGYQIGYGLQIAATVRRLNPQIPIVWGGVHPTIHPDSTIRHALVDVVVIGEGEETAVDLARALETGGDLKAVQGLAVKDSETVVCKTQREKLVMDALARPDYSLVDVNSYFTVGHLSQTGQLQIHTSRGCPFNCAYCYLRLPELRGFRSMSAQRAYEDIRYLSERYGAKSMYFCDDFFFADRKRVVDFIALIEKNPLGVQFEVPCRIDFLVRESDEFLARMRSAGFVDLLIGVESGSDRILAMIRKGISREDVLCANRKLAKARIGAKMSWMAGFPTEKAEDFYETVDLMLQLTRENPFCSLTPLGIYTPYPGTELFEICKRDYGVTFPESLEGWASYQWQANNNMFLDRRAFRLLTRLNFASRFFDAKLFERFGQKNHQYLIMALFHVYGSWMRLRARFRFFELMPEIEMLKWLQDHYIEYTHKKQQSRADL